MHLLDIERPTNGSGTLHLYAIGDTHLDLRGSDHAKLARYLDHICRDPYSVAVFVGDLLDGRVPGRKHFDAGSVRVDFLENLKSYVNHGLDVADRLFRPLVKAKVPLVCVSGNHDDYLEEIGLTAEFVRRLGGSARYLGGEGFIRVRSGRKRRTTHGDEGGMYTTVIHATHGSGGGRTPGPKVNAMQRTFEWVDADVAIAGHVHDADIRIIPAYGVARSGVLELVKRPRVMYRAGSFVERATVGVDSYAGRKSYGSNDDGLLYVALNPLHRTALRHEFDAAA
jgi:predicted phosphodiesterase